MRNFSILLSVVTLTACLSSQEVKTDAKEAGSAALDCTKAEIGPMVLALVPSFLELFDGKLPDWHTSADTLTSALGDAGKCAADKALALLEEKLSHVKAGMAVDNHALVNAKQYMNAKNWKFKK